MRIMLIRGALLSAACAIVVGCGDVATEAGGLSSDSAILGDGSEKAGTERYIVQLDGTSQSRALIGQLDIAADMSQQNAIATYLTADDAERLGNRPGVEYVEIDPIREPYMESTPYGITLVQGDLVAEPETDGIGVCIIDSGYLVDHEDLQDQNVTGSDLVGPALEDGCGHGSHVAGTVAALSGNDVGVVGLNGNGNINLHIVRFFRDNCGASFGSNLVNALEECRASGAKVINMSLGGGRASQTERRAFADALASGFLPIAAAGNSGNTAKSYPASYDAVVSVAAVDRDLNLASFSQRNDQVELAAPGVGVMSTVPDRDISSVTVGGTEFSAAQMSGSRDSDGVSGVLVDGGLCTSSGDWDGAIVLCQRGEISFEDKHNNAASGGAVAAVIYNNAAGGFNGTIGDGTSEIPVVATDDATGADLMGNLGKSADLVALVAEGLGGYAEFSGTSMASPHVAGVAALIWRNVPDASPQSVRQAMTQTAVDLGSSGRDNSFGYGLVQAGAALEYLQSGPGDCEPTEAIETECNDGIDNDCDGLIDGNDSDCEANQCLPNGDSCSSDDECCSGNCGGFWIFRSCR
ncbi:MAG: S8 family serine peptidase [Myxococcota bacterium]